jgi:laminin alpha 3/5
VSLDIALEGYNPNTSKAMAVEQCQCPQPYKGLSCEDCAPGYYRSQTGPYGGYCVPCQCNGHSETCDEVTGICYVSIFHYRIVSARYGAPDGAAR